MATEDQLDRVRRYVAMRLSQGERMESTTTRLVILSESLAGARATVDTDEQWSLVYRDAASGRTLRTEDYRIRVRYHLLERDGAWQVYDIEELERTTL